MPAIKININPDFYKTEIIDGYQVSEKTKKIWAVEVDLLMELLRVCTKHNIRFCAFAGTLLGAIRHQGFIPWADDLDVCFERKEYNKLLEVASSEFEYPYFFQTAKTDRKFFIGYARLRNSETTGIIKWNTDRDYNNGIYIDIYVLDGYTSNSIALSKQLFKRNFYQRLCKLYYFESENEIPTIFKRFVKMAKNILTRTVSYDYLVDKYEKTLQIYENSDNVTMLTEGKKWLPLYWCRKIDLQDIIYQKFEMVEIPIPKNYDAILKNIYGNYMDFPPVEKRGAWHEDWLIFEPEIPYKIYLEKKRRYNEK